MIYLWLYIRFFFVGLFAVGGGLATLPFLYEMAEKTGWFTVHDISNLVAVSESTPGPMGVNMSTYVGFITGGPLGSVVGPLGLITPSIIVIIAVSLFLNKFKESKLVQNVFYCLRPASAALVAYAGLGVVKLAFVGSSFTPGLFTSYSFIVSVVMAVVIYVCLKKLKLHPVAYIALAAVAGIVFKINVV